MYSDSGADHGGESVDEPTGEQIESNGKMPAVQNEVRTHSVAISLTDLPGEILLKILQFVPQLQLATLVASVNRRLRDVALDPRLWMTVDFTSFGNWTLPSPASFRRFLRRCPYLRALRVNSPAFDYEVLLDTRKYCPDLICLDLSANCDLDAQEIKDAVLTRDSSGKLWDLQELCLQGVTNFSADFFRPKTDDNMPDVLQTITNIQTLDLSYNDYLSENFIDYILPCCRKLEKIRLGEVRHVTSIGVAKLLECINSTLTELTLDGEQLRDAALRSIGNAHELRMLHISFCDELTDDGLMCLRPLGKLQSLQLRKGSAFTNECILKLFALCPNGTGPFPELSVLDLTECAGLLDSGIIEIGSGCAELKVLLVAWCWELTDYAFCHLTDSCRKLLKLDLTGVKRLRGEWIRLLPQILPKLRVLILRDVNNVSDIILQKVAEDLDDCIVIDYYGSSMTPLGGSDLSWRTSGSVSIDGMILTY